MIIPITCPGCSVAFEVPDNLVGKTIRCTSCKTQLSVTAPVEAAKKGFGWASKSGLTATTDAEPIPEPIRETNASAKTVPSAPRPKPAAKVNRDTDGDDDEDDEEPETKPSEKKTKIAAATGASFKGGNAKKRRDEDEEDDAEEKPKRKKKQKDEGGSGAMIAMIAGGVITLGAVVGLAIWLLSGDKKPDTASNTGNSTPANSSTAPPVPPGTGGTGPKPSPGLENAAWQPVSANGLACEMPGNPIQRNEPIAGGGTLKLYLLESPSKDFAFFASEIPLPGPIPANLTGKMLSDSAAGFERGMNGGGIGGGGFGRNSPIRVASTTDIQQDGFPGKELQLAGKNGNPSVGGVVRLVLAGKQMYMFGVGADNYAALRPQSQRFMSSVKITAQSNPGGPVVINDPPPKMPPGTGTTPGGDPPVKPPGGDPVPPIGQPPVGQPPAGGEVAGKLAAKLNNTFLAGAFDPEKKELLVVGLRTIGPRQAGAILRYSYPDFKLIATVNIPSAATRAQLDAEKGLLYLTTMGSGINPTANQFDRPAYVGDVAVYDLAQLLSGKFDEKTELKPAGIIPVGFTRNIIRDIVLSGDGKSLFILSSASTGKAKSQVIQVNTSDRKTVKSKDLPSAGWDMVRSTDGLKLYITGLAAGAQAPPLMVLETETMNLAPNLTLPKAAFNIAVAKDGRIVTCSLSTAPGAGVGGVGLGGFGPIGPGGPGGPIGPGGGIVIGGVGGAVVNPLEINVLDSSGSKVDGLRPNTDGVSNNGYIGVSPDGKYLICSTHHPLLLGSGLDVYETSDKFIGDKKVASIKQAGEAHLGGTFLISPDSEYIVFLNGAVLKLDDMIGGPVKPQPPGGVGGIGNPGGIGGIGGNPGGIGFPQPPPGFPLGKLPK